MYKRSFCVSIHRQIFTHADAADASVAGGRVFITVVCPYICFSTRYFKNPGARINKTWRRNVPSWVLEVHLFRGQKVELQGHEAQIQCRFGFFHSCECWLHCSYCTLQLYVANKMSLAMQQPFNTFYETGTASEVGGCTYLNTSGFWLLYVIRLSRTVENSNAVFHSRTSTGRSFWIWIINIYPRRGVKVYTGVCLSVCLSVCLFFRTICQNPKQLGSPNLTQKYSTMRTVNPNPFILGSKGQSQGYEAQRQCRRGSWHSRECWLLVV